MLWSIFSWVMVLTFIPIMFAKFSLTMSNSALSLDMNISCCRFLLRYIFIEKDICLYVFGTASLLEHLMLHDVKKFATDKIGTDLLTTGLLRNRGGHNAKFFLKYSKLQQVFVYSSESWLLLKSPEAEKPLDPQRLILLRSLLFVFHVLYL